jgi:CRISPR/Cas system-associated endonuclease/helicase Cas3
MVFEPEGDFVEANCAGGAASDELAEVVTFAVLPSLAATGQHVLWIRNTVHQAQSAYRMISALVQTGVRVGLLHSHFPECRRAELKADWLERFGPNRPSGGPGSILVATQVVEQNVDIDVDFLLSDLAPTEILLQRLGKLWRHERAIRAASAPVAWIRIPYIPKDGDARDLRTILVRSVWGLRSLCSFA